MESKSEQTEDLKLFCVYDTNKNMVVSRGFSDKPSAKKVRNILNKDNKSKERFVVKRDIDHRLGQSY